MKTETLRVGIVQRVLPAYRAAFFDLLAETLAGELGVFSGLPRPQEALGRAGVLTVARHFPAVNRHLLSGKLYLCWQSGLSRWLKTWQPQVLIAEANPRYLRLGWMVRWMRRRGRPVIGWGLGAPAVGVVRQFFWRRFIHQFDALITYSQKGADEYAALGFAPERIFVAANAAARRPVHALPLRGETSETNRAKIIFVGRLQARKRVDVLLRACSNLSEAQQPEIIIVGDGPERIALEAEAKKTYPLAWFAGERHGEELADLFRRADLFVLPGTGGLAIQEAMSYGLPVVVGEADGTQADLVRPENGWLVQSGDVDDLRRILVEALSDLPRLRRMGENSYQIVSREINLEKMAAVFMRAIDATLEA